jgi:hypothetical protein
LNFTYNPLEAPIDTHLPDDPALGGAAPQNTDPDKVTGDVVQQSTTDNTTSGGKSETPNSAAPPPAETIPPSSAKEAPSSPSQPKRRLSLRSPAWLKKPFGKKKEGQTAVNGGVNRQATGGASLEAKETKAGLPPNHLSEEVPPAPSTSAEEEVHKAAEESTQPQQQQAQAQESAPQTVAQATSSSPPESNPTTEEKSSSSGTRSGNLFSLNPFTWSSNSNQQQQNNQNQNLGLQAAAEAAAESPQPQKLSENQNGKLPDRSPSINAPDGRRRSYIPEGHINPSRIPIAGGIPVGQGERRTSKE